MKWRLAHTYFFLISLLLRTFLIHVTHRNKYLTIMLYFHNTEHVLKSWHPRTKEMENIEDGSR